MSEVCDACLRQYCLPLIHGMWSVRWLVKFKLTFARLLQLPFVLEFVVRITFPASSASDPVFCSLHVLQVAMRVSQWRRFDKCEEVAKGDARARTCHLVAEAADWLAPVQLPDGIS